MSKHIELIDDYVVTDGNPPDFQFYDNRGELIRCGNCEYWRQLPLRIDGQGSCAKHRSIVSPPDWYCADGVKK